MIHETCISGKLGNIRIGSRQAEWVSKGHPLAHGFGRSKRIMRSAGVAVKIPLPQAQVWFQHQTGCIESPCPAEWADKTASPYCACPL